MPRTRQEVAILDCLLEKQRNIQGENEPRQNAIVVANVNKAAIAEQAKRKLNSKSPKRGKKQKMNVSETMEVDEIFEQNIPASKSPQMHKSKEIKKAAGKKKIRSTLKDQSSKTANQQVERQNQNDLAEKVNPERGVRRSLDLKTSKLPENMENTEIEDEDQMLKMQVDADEDEFRNTDKESSDEEEEEMQYQDAESEVQFKDQEEQISLVNEEELNDWRNSAPSTSGVEKTTKPVEV